MAACGGDPGTSPNVPSIPSAPSVVGTWHIATVNNLPLPYLLERVGTDQVTIISGGVTFTSSGQWSESLTLTASGGGQSITGSSSLSGTYVQNGADITVQASSTGGIG